MKQLLSIIIPCYNCADTLEEAVGSCFVQGLENFEIVMVDDGSTDSTKSLMQELAKKHPKIKLFYHDKNRGGGATRNTGIKNANGTLIFCLDSDNILDAESLQKMIDFLERNKADGVAFHERRFFHSKSKKMYTSHFNTFLDKPITINNIFDRSGILLDNFLYTKESFLKTSQYPEHHGFDTQSFEMRYLSSRSLVLVCPGTFFYHRQNHSELSYFEREFNKGNFSVNYYLAIEDIWRLLSSYAKREILMYDVFKNSSLGENLAIVLQDLYSKNKLFISQEPQGKTADNLYDDFIANYKQKKYSEALDACKKLLESKINSKIIYFAILRSSVGLSGEDSKSIEKRTAEIIDGLITRPRVLNQWYTRNLLMFRSIQIIKKIWKK